MPLDISGMWRHKAAIWRTRGDTRLGWRGSLLMLNFFAKFILVLSSLSPVLITISIKQVELNQTWTSWASYLYLFIGLILVAVCWALLSYASKNAQKYPLYIQEFERRDQEVLTFLFIYLLPFIRSSNLVVVDNWLTSLFVLIIIMVSLVYADALHFNPVMRLLGYRFYSVKDKKGISNILISKKDLRQGREEVRTVRLSVNIYLYIGE